MEKGSNIIIENEIQQTKEIYDDKTIDPIVILCTYVYLTGYIIKEKDCVYIYKIN